MSHAQATRWLVVALVTVAASAVGRSLIDDGELPGVRTVIGVFVFGALLALVLEVNPKLAGSFAALVALGSVLSAGRLFVAVEDALTRT